MKGNKKMNYMICWDMEEIYYTGKYDCMIALNSSLMGIEVDTFKTEKEMEKKLKEIQK